jgi:predicted neuraminidase
VLPVFAAIGNVINSYRPVRMTVCLCVVMLFAVGCTGQEKKMKNAMHDAIVQQEFIYAVEKAPTPQCHASTIAETENILVAAWFGGTAEKNKDVGIWFSRYDSQEWSPPLEVVNGVQKDGTRYPCWNPVLFQPSAGALILFYKVGPDPDDWWGMRVTSSDGGKNWSMPERLPDHMIGPVKDKPVELADGTILCPSSREDEGWTVHIEKTDKDLKNWVSTGRLNDPEKFSAIQPTILTYPDQRLQILCRTGNGVISQCWSSDNGLTWDEMTATELPNPNSGIDAVTLADGRQLLVYNPDSSNWGDRVPLSLAVSTDGRSWTRILDLEPLTDPDKKEDDEFSYPAVIQTQDGLVHVVYTYQRKTIKHMVIDPKKL